MLTLAKYKGALEFVKLLTLKEPMVLIMPVQLTKSSEKAVN
jgi:hypothetical protein